MVCNINYAGELALRELLQKSLGEVVRTDYYHHGAGFPSPLFRADFLSDVNQPSGLLSRQRVSLLWCLPMLRHTFNA